MQLVYVYYLPKTRPLNCILTVLAGKSYVFKSTEHGANLFKFKEEGYIYRYCNDSLDHMTAVPIPDLTVAGSRTQPSMSLSEE